ncbi:hypothetical protein MVES_003048 [Malassezia vespertilionis]|uniref:DH domain-containing protein n=1 Tax=Malassezia vespertilionis TaxID=2020962 RepID=A0A2N1J9X7_9BASI|nr:hypothetical protein MVES_003048 [Malassezia vespertilionis]
MSGASDGGIAAGPASARCTPGAPMPANSIANKQVGPRSGLYQSCLALSERLWCVPEFGERYLGAATRVAPVAISVSNDALVSNDPVSHLWQCFRLGTPLCALFNHLAPQIPQISVHVEGNLNNANACKALVMRFLIALKERLGWDPDETFTVSQLYLNDTNGFVKVVRSVNKLLDLLEDRGILQERPVMPWSARSDPLLSPSDTRMHVVKELVESERKYVNDLEIMQNYALMLAQHDLVAPDTVHLLFGNLHQLVDIQRRFLIAVEENARRPADEQHFGLLFQSMEEGFSVYEPFCANYAQALAIISAETPALVQAKSLPAAQSCYLDPSYELPTFLIKPVQRICKYPLLLEQLLKNTPQDAPRYAELSDGLQIIRRITDKVNETKRYQENVQAMHDLETRVEDWKGHSLKTFGRLLLNDTFMVSKGDSEREFQVYLFERILLCCKDLSATTIGLPGAVGATRGRARNGSLLRQRQGSVSGNGKKEVRAPLQLKGRIFMNNIVGINGQSRAGGMPELPVGMYALQVWWRGESDVESFSLRCKNDEQLKIWHTALQRLLDAALSRRPSLTQPIPNTSQRSQPAMSLNLSGTQYQWSREAFMQVSTPIVPTPTSELSMSGFLSRNSASHFGEDDLPSTPGTPGSATPFAVPMRSCTDPELLHELGSPHEDQDPLSTFWRRSATQLNGYNSPTVPPLKSFQGSPLSASITGHVSPSTYESIEPDFHNLSQYSIATPRTGFAAGRAAAVQANGDRILILNDEDLAIAFDQARIGGTPQLDLTVEG